MRKEAELVGALPRPVAYVLAIGNQVTPQGEHQREDMFRQGIERVIANVDDSNANHSAIVFIDDIGAGCRDGDREPGSHYRRLFACAPGDPARLAAASCDYAHLGCIFWPNLYPPREYCAAHWGADASRLVPHIERARVGLWYRGCDDNGRRRCVGICRYLEIVGLALVAGRASHWAPRDRRWNVLLCQPSESL